MVGHRRVRPQLHMRAGPKSHEVPVTGVADVSGGVHSGVEAHELVDPGHVVVAHVLVVAPVAGGQHHGLGVDLGVDAVGVVLFSTSKSAPSTNQSKSSPEWSYQ